MPLLNQIVAVEKSVKQKSSKTVTELYKSLQRSALTNGLSRVYRPKDDDGDKLPSESTLVQQKAGEIITALIEAKTDAWDVVATKEIGNTGASADIVVDGEVILADVPVTYLLFLEKELQDVRTFVGAIPVLDPADEWHYDAARGVYATDPTETTRTKKVPRNWVKAEATDKHQAQVEVYHEDVVVGYWATTKFSGGLPADRIKELLGRVDKLVDAVKFAREQANSVEVQPKSLASGVFGYLFA